MNPPTPTVAVVRRRQPLGRRRLLAVIGFTAPFVVLFALLYVAPVLYAFVQSFFKVYRASTYEAPSVVFAGLEQYATALSSDVFWTGLGRVLLLLVIQVPITIGLATLFALLLDSPVVKGRKFFRLAFFAPYAVPSVIAAIMWGFFYAPTLSPVPALATGIDFLGSAVLLAIGNILTWTVAGFNMLIIYSSLQSIPQEVYEAARIDGASETRIAWSIKVPLISPAIVLGTVFSIIGAFQLFNEPTVLRALSNGITSTFTPNMLIFNTSATPDYNLAAAYSVVLALITCVLSFGFLRLTRLRSLS
ncbi:carbohydrate ABC transporter permease [Herbiconiux ginsengi]|uniref:Carbohydrate ABC transporter membrane protein 1, CUT1 family n=2 Tax=Herbiconiux ginsengi TaxID=381665 RepID=A0A1H3U1K7_9MICO|nr:sugar ABC transporter permease [Herbiconiux ginsengi]SDZ56197.1 carbohydrate ABC transporter membrane protein 1, CUT1 family [Herbiconiux ginsengi]